MERFVLAAAAVRARLLPPFLDKDPYLFIGTELVRFELLPRKTYDLQTRSEAP